MSHLQILNHSISILINIITFNDFFAVSFYNENVMSFIVWYYCFLLKFKNALLCYINLKHFNLVCILKLFTVWWCTVYNTIENIYYREFKGDKYISFNYLRWNFTEVIMTENKVIPENLVMKTKFSGITFVFGHHHLRKISAQIIECKIFAPYYFLRWTQYNTIFSMIILGSLSVVN